MIYDQITHTVSLKFELNKCILLTKNANIHNEKKIATINT